MANEENRIQKQVIGKNEIKEERETVGQKQVGIHERPVKAPDEAVEPSVPKLLPTPVSEQIAAPKFSDMPEPITDISDQVPVPQLPLLPSTEVPPAEEPAVPEVPQQPLPDILVDPFMEDVGQSKTSSRSRVALASSLETVPVNALREGEPKRLSPSQKGIIARELAAPRATRIIFKGSFDGKIEP
jgi:hypothetical protein